MHFLLLLADVPSPARSPHASSGTPVWLLVAVPVAVIVIGICLLLLLRSRRRAHQSATVAGDHSSDADRAAEDERV